MRRESGGGVSCGELPENIRNKGREGCDADRFLLWGGSDESRRGALTSRLELQDGGRSEGERRSECELYCAAERWQ